MMNSEHNLNYDGEPSPVEQAPTSPVLVNDSEGANYTVEGAQEDWEEGPPDESAHYDPHDEEEDPYNNNNDDDDGPEAFDDPYAETPFPDEYDDPYANTPYATDDQGQYVHDPYGELDYSGRPTADDLEDIDMSHRDPDNIQGGEYELDSHDPKTQGMQAWLTKYGKTAGTLATMACLVTVLAAIILVASSAGGNSHSRAPRHADGSSSPWGLRKESNQLQSKFVPPPLALQAICTQENIATQDGFDSCTVLCEPAQCCRFDPITEPKASCQRGHVQDCHTYHHYCERPPKAAIIPFVPPPDNIHQLCTKEKMHTPQGVTDCARACQGGTCCRYPTSLTGLSCLRGNEEQCQVYHLHCEQPPPEEEEAKDNAMADENIQFPFVPPPSDITEKCSGNSVATSAGFGACLEICRSGTCCRFDPEREASLSCRNEHPSDCPIYDQYCGGNTNVVSSQPVHNNGETGISGGNPDKETYVEKVCSDHSLATVEGFADCQQACNEFECCWRAEFGSTCPVGTHCEPYSHCLAMEASDYIDVSIQVSINLKCTDELISTQQGRRDCLLACSQATCCFGNRGGECPHADDSFCNQYDACEKVSEIHENVPPAPSNMGKVCEKEHLNTLQGLAECDRACSKATCCWQESDSQSSCEKTNPLCSDYAPCFILNEGTIVETYPPIPSAPATLETVCSETDGDETACSEFCEPAECCWKSGKCTHDQSIACKGYAPCASLLGDIPDPPSNLDQVCKKDLVDTAAGMQGCEMLCDPGACCWRTGACLGMHPEKCESYIPCAIIMANDQPTSAPSPVPEAPELIKETCTHANVATADGEMLCADICKVAECCWKTGACLSTQPDTCEGYVPCAALLDFNQPSEDSASTIVEASLDVQTECTSDGVATANGRAACAAACKPAECCWKSGSCLGINPDTCKGYTPCSVLLDDSISAAAPSDLTDICSRDNIQNAVGAAACEAICETADCCWKVGNCIAAQSDVCEGYVPCAVLNENTPVTMPTAPSFLKDVCTQEKVQNVEGQILCQDACKVAECCWNTGTCLSTYPDQCEGYVSCAVLTTDGEGTATATIPKAPSYLETVCGSEIAGDEVHGHLCVNACYRATCCWNPDSTTPCPNDPNCDSGYDICANVKFDSVVPPTEAPLPTPAPVQGSTPAPAPTDGVDQGYTEGMITDACLNHDNSIVNLCAKVCAPSDCCFDRNGDSGESCSSDFPCYKFGACAMLHPEENYVDVACASDDLSDCVAACGDSTCCFTNDIEKTCAVTNPNMICSRYTACERLYGTGGRHLRG